MITQCCNLAVTFQGYFSRKSNAATYIEEWDSASSREHPVSAACHFYGCQSGMIQCTMINWGLVCGCEPFVKPLKES